MLHVTDRAKEVLLRKKLAHVRDSAMGLRLASPGPGRLALVADRVKAGDQVVRHGDEPVLLVAAELSELVLAGKTIDCRPTEDGALELVLRISVHGA
jgi:hypothetical protein